VAEFALDEGARLLQIHPLEAAGRAIRELGESFPDAVEESYAYLLAAQLQQSLRGRLQVQLDLLSRRLMADQPNLFFAGESDPCGSLADRVRPLIIEADGTVVPIEHGFDRSFSLGNLRDARLRELATHWLANGYVRFRDLCGRAFAAVTAEDRPPLADWSAALRSAAIEPVAAGA